MVFRARFFAMAAAFAAFSSCSMSVGQNDLNKDNVKMEIWAHRGCSYEWPENTLPAFKAAAALDITGIELDIQLTKDNKIVVFHDETLDRVTDTSGNLRDFTLAQLKKVNVKTRAGLKPQDARIPTIEEVFDLLSPYCKKRGLLINIELKTSRVRYEGIEELILKTVSDYGLEKYIVYSSFLPDSIILIKEKNPAAKTAILNASLAYCADFAAGRDVDALHPNVHRLDASGEWNKKGLAVRAWGSSEPFYPNVGDYEKLDLEALAAQGVTGIFTNVPEYYCSAGYKVYPLLQEGAAISYKTGFFVGEDNKKHLSDFHFYEVNPGDEFDFKAWGYLFQLAFYNDRIDPKLIHTYCYSDEESWATYTNNLQKFGWRFGKRNFREHGWARLLVRRLDGKPVGQADKAALERKCFFLRKKVPYKSKPFFDAEIQDTAGKVNALRAADVDTLVLGLITDNHYVINGRWEDTAANLRAVNKKAPFDALVHLGDFTDGMTPLAITREYFGLVNADLKKLGVPLYYCLGNHDSNYFRKNPESVDALGQSRLYLQREEPHYYVDFAGKKLRALFLHSYDHMQEGQGKRYGFDDAEVEWVKTTLAQTPADYKVLIFSHVPLLAKMHFWSDEIRNEAAMVQVLQDFNAGAAGQKGRLLAFVHGHIHSDWVNDTDLSFPIVSIGCAKIEDDQVKKSAGSTTYSRALDDATQDLWDVLVVNARTGRLDFVRFGAGADRTLGK